jgi:hypothetical protein
MESQVEEKLKEWKKYYSKSRNRDYYFNARTKKSLWTLEEVKQLIREEIENNTISQKDLVASTNQQDQACAVPLVLI